MEKLAMFIVSIRGLVIIPETLTFLFTSVDALLCKGSNLFAIGFIANNY